MSDDLYSQMEIILDYYKNPKNAGIIENPDIHAEDYNIPCGDHVEIFVKIKDGKVIDAKFRGEGCIISQASASMLMERIVGMSLDDVKKLTKKDILSMLGINLSPTRMKCALLSLKVLNEGISKYEGKEFDLEKYLREKVEEE
ncbi:MAG: iron-sulfur cluster assembly scaffold protein [Thermoprotei archaeon]